MRKNKILLAFAILEVIVFFSAMRIKIEGYSLSSLWVNFAILFIGIYSILYSLMFKLDSSLYYGMLLIFIAITTSYSFVNGIEFYFFYPFYILCVAFSHFTVFVFFRQIIHFKVFVFLIIECILLIGYKSNLINWLLLIGINSLYLFYMLINLILRVAKNLRREQ